MVDMRVRASGAKDPGITLVDDGRLNTGAQLWSDERVFSQPKGAILSEDAIYRYLLWRVWEPALPRDLWIMLNPSTADAAEDDPTIRRCVGFSKARECGGIMVANLFALRATDPRKLWTTEPEDRVGESADLHLGEAIKRSFNGKTSCGIVVVAWGVLPPAARHRAEDVSRLIADHGRRGHCYGLTQSGHPKHPLYLPGTAKPELFWGARA